MNSLESFRSHWLPLLESELHNCMKQAAQELTIGKAGQYALMGPGKRMRPLLTLMAADVCGADPVAAMPAAMAVEMVHAFSLVHDDLPCMDDDDLRRGRPTTHKVFGEAMALLAGDALLASAFQKLALLPPEVSAKCGTELSFATVMMIEGQGIDIQGLPEVATAGQMDHLNNLKTGALISCALKMGGIVAGGSKKQLEALSKYGQALGLAFQITDDLLDLTGSEESTGKKVGKDAGRGKRTYPGVLGIEESKKRAEELVDEAVGAAKIFGQKGEMLGVMARWIIERRR